MGISSRPENHVVVVGDKVRLTQQIPHGRGCWKTCVVGCVLAISQERTGAWYAHGRNGKLWLDRVVILQDDGDEIDCILDRYSVLEWVERHPVEQKGPD